MSTLLRHAAAASLFAVALGACATRPANLDLSLEKPTVAGRYRVSLEPPTATPAINQIHSWMVRLEDANGSPVTDASLTVAGGMPEHGHGFPTKPRVTREVASGTYLVEGMKFSMPGWWNIKFDIQSPQGQDKVTFNTIVAPRAARR